MGSGKGISISYPAWAGLSRSPGVAGFFPAATAPGVALAEADAVVVRAVVVEGLAAVPSDVRGLLGDVTGG